jgi:adenylate cyclase
VSRAQPRSSDRGSGFTLTHDRSSTEAAGRPPSLAWLPLTIGAMLGVHFFAGFTTYLMSELMRSVSEFALAVRAFEYRLIPWYNAVAYSATTAAIFAYLWPVVAYFRAGARGAPAPRVQRRVIAGPFLISLASFAAWVGGVLLFPAATIVRFGRWSPDLASQQVLAPLVNGFLAATICYLTVDWIFRRLVTPHVFPRGGVTAASRTLSIGVQVRLLVFLTAVAFVPLFSMLGLVQAAAARVRAGWAVEGVLASLQAASQATFAVYVILGVALTLLLGRTLTRPLADVTRALRRVQAGDLEVRLTIDATDELGVLEEGVNGMVGALRDREHIIQTFGRVVEPAVRDQLLDGRVDRRGELRRATVLFCDLRGFTRLAAERPPDQVVETLNGFFAAMTACVRECGGFVDKFIGDAMLVVFGLIDPGDGDGAASARAALRCAAGMRARLAALNAERDAAGAPPLAVAIAAHTGQVLAGTIGADDRHEYTVIGDTVNVAARLQQLCKERDHDLLISEDVYAAAAPETEGYAVAFRDRVTLRGRSRPVEVLGIAGAAPPARSPER